MPVSQLLLLCEGQERGLDVLVLNKILNGIATISPEGSKNDLPHRFLWHRKQKPAPKVAIFRDRDFDHLSEDTNLLDRPRPFSIKAPGPGTPIPAGWTWERVTIENYLLDPEVVQRAWGRPFPEYREALANAARSLGPYTAARLALSGSRPVHSGLPNKWAKSASPWPPQPADCRTLISELVTAYSSAHKLEPDPILSKFNTYLPVCEPQGARGQHPLVFFSGEDLLDAMQPALAKMKLPQGDPFLEKAAEKIANCNEDVWTWLPEWRALRQLVAEGTEL